MKIEILTRIGFEPRTQTPGTVLAVPGEVSPEEAAHWISRGLAVEVPEEPSEPEEKPEEKPKKGRL